MDSKTSFFFQALNFGMEVEPLPWQSGKPRTTCIIRSGSGYGSGFSRTTLITEKMAVLAPIPRANAATAMAVKAGALAQHAQGMAQVGEQALHARITFEAGRKFHYLDFFRTLVDPRRRREPYNALTFRENLWRNFWTFGATTYVQ